LEIRRLLQSAAAAVIAPRGRRVAGKNELKGGNEPFGRKEIDVAGRHAGRPDRKLRANI
jgi:hypothetical protein